MFGLRILLFFAGIALVVWILVRLARGPRPSQRPRVKSGDTVKCARCGVYVPREDAVRDGERYYCSEQHRLEDQGERR